MLMNERLLGTMDHGCYLPKVLTIRLISLVVFRLALFVTLLDIKEIWEASCFQLTQPFGLWPQTKEKMETIIFLSITSIKRLAKKLRVWDLAVTTLRKTANCGLIRIWIKAQFLMETIRPTVMVCLQIQCPKIWISRRCKFGVWEPSLISRNKPSTGVIEKTSKFILNVER